MQKIDTSKPSGIERLRPWLIGVIADMLLFNESCRTMTTTVLMNDRAESTDNFKREF